MNKNDCYCEKHLKKTQFLPFDNRPIFLCIQCGKYYLIGDNQLEEVRSGTKNDKWYYTCHVRHVKPTDL